MKQRDLEEEMVELGKSRYQSKVAKATQQELETTTPVGQKLLRESVPELTKAIDKWKREASSQPGRRHRALDYIDVLPSKVVSGLTARSVLDAISQQRKITSSAVRLGRLLEDEINFRILRDNNREMWNQINRVLNRFTSQKNKTSFIKKTANYHGILFDKWPRKDAASVGLTCIELMRQATGLIDIVTKVGRGGRSSTYVRATEDLDAWLREAHKAGEMLRPVLLPMVEPPQNWKGMWGGGYLGDSFARQRSMVKTEDRGYLEELDAAPMPKVYRAVNAIQRTPMAINNPVVDVMRHCWENGLSVGGLPTVQNIELPTKPTDIATNEDNRKAWRRQAAAVHFENERQKSKRLQVAKVLYLAEKFKDESLYYPHQLDKRARGYPLPYFLQPQGPDWSRSMLKFAKGMRMDDNGVSWLAVHVANGWGMDKDPFSERIAWVEDNQDLISAIAKDPLGCMEWTKADEPWKFLSGCVDWYGLMCNGKEYESQLPVALDATTQGLQIYAMIGRDEAAAYETNVLPRDRPGDVYQAVCDKTIEKLKVSDNPYAPVWLQFGITRSSTKRQSMTLCYGSTFFSCRTYTAEWFYNELRDKNRENPFGQETYRPCNFLAELIWESIGEVVGSARAGMDWLREVASICLDNDTPIRWVTPLGFPVLMDYRKKNKNVVKTVVNGVIRQHRVLEDNEDRDRRKSINAFPPNVIHSLDGLGGLLGETINLGLDNGVDNYLAVHDSIATHAQLIGILSGCIREATISIFEEPIFNNLRDSLLASLPSGVQLPAEPPKGNLRLTQVRDSEYYFS